MVSVAMLSGFVHMMGNGVVNLAFIVGTILLVTNIIPAILIFGSKRSGSGES